MPKGKGKSIKARGKPYDHKKRANGRFRVDNFPGTCVQLKTWVFSMYSQYKSEMKFREMDGYYIIEYFKDYLAEKLIMLNGAQFSGCVVSVSPMNDAGQRGITVSDMIREICLEGYNRENSHMDISHLPERLAAKGFTKHLDLPLQTKVIDHVKANYPTSNSIDYSFNGLTTLHIFREIHQSMPQLIGLNLSNNNIKNLDQLEHIKEIPLEVLSLNDNPILAENGFNLFVSFISLYYIISTSTSISVILSSNNKIDVYDFIT